MYILNNYDDALRLILETGTRRRNRTGVDTLSVFSITASYQIDQFFPLCTKRKLRPKSVFAELLWMLSGSTNNDDLVKLGCNFWTPWVDLANPENRALFMNDLLAAVDAEFGASVVLFKLNRPALDEEFPSEIAITVPGVDGPATLSNTSALNKLSPAVLLTSK